MNDAGTISMTSPPSRLDNPFATCWTRPGALPFRFAGDVNADLLVAKLAAQNGWGAIIGPHGSGKSTLLESLKGALPARGYDVYAICLRTGQRTLPSAFAERLSACDSSSMIIIDGYEQLGPWERWRLHRRVRRQRTGLLVTSHQPTGIPELITLSPDRELVEELVRALCAQVSTAVTADDIAASHACHGSNVREIFFELYDRHEERGRGLHPLPMSSQRLTRSRV